MKIIYLGRVTYVYSYFMYWIKSPDYTKGLFKANEIKRTNPMPGLGIRNFERSILMSRLKRIAYETNYDLSR